MVNKNKNFCGQDFLPQGLVVVAMLPVLLLSGIVSVAGGQAAVVTKEHFRPHNIAFTVPSPDHEIDFRGCADGVATKDSFSSLRAVASEGTACSPQGLTVSKGSHVIVDPWTWGGSVSFEVFVKHDRLIQDCRVFQFTASEGPRHGIFLSNEGDTANAIFSMHKHGVTSHVAGNSLWEIGSGSWVHVVVTVEVGQGTGHLRLYKDGILFSSVDDPELVHPEVSKRDLTLGSSPDQESLHGVISQFRVWHGKVLDSGQVKLLYAKRNMKDALSPPVLPKPRLAIILYGEMARWQDRALMKSYTCSEMGMIHQNATTESQRKYFFGYIQDQLGYDVDIFLSTHDCVTGSFGVNRDPNAPFEKTLRAAFSPWLKDLSFGKCEAFRGTHCLLRPGIEMLNNHDAPHGKGADGYTTIMFARPDIMFKPKGTEFVKELVERARTSIVWPFRCEDYAWDMWNCVSDVFMVMPAPYFASYFNGCLGHSGCFPDAYGDNFVDVFFDQVGFNGVGINLGATGHTCYRCLDAAQQRWQNWSFIKSPTRMQNTAFKEGKPYSCQPQQIDRDPSTCESACLNDKLKCLAWSLDSATGKCCLHAYTSTQIETPRVVSGLVPMDDHAMLLGSITADFALDAHSGVNTRGGNMNSYFRMADVSEPDQGYPRSRRALRGSQQESGLGPWAEKRAS